MKKRTRVVAYKNLPARLPVWSTITIWLVFDRLKMPGWVWGAAGCLFIILWIVRFIEFWQQVETDIFDFSDLRAKEGGAYESTAKQ